MLYGGIIETAPFLQALATKQIRQEEADWRIGINGTICLIGSACEGYATPVPASSDRFVLPHEVRSGSCRLHVGRPGIRVNADIRHRNLRSDGRGRVRCRVPPESGHDLPSRGRS